MALPAWLAAMVQVPVVTPVMVAPLVPLAVHTAGVVLVKVTGLPEAPPVAEAVPVPPTTTVGAVSKTMVWLPAPTVLFCVTWVAAL